MSIGPRDVSGEVTISRPPLFGGSEGVTTRTFQSLEAARDFVRSINNGQFDRFLGFAWDQMTIERNRNQAGQFIRPAWRVNVFFIRPEKGERYDISGPVPSEPLPF